jgi:hypothetical protein
MEDIMTLLPRHFLVMKDVVHIHQLNKYMNKLYNNDSYIVALLFHILRENILIHKKLPRYNTFLLIFSLSETKSTKRIKNINYMYHVTNIMSIRNRIKEIVYSHILMNRIFYLHEKKY